MLSVLSKIVAIISNGRAIVGKNRSARLKSSVVIIKKNWGKKNKMAVKIKMAAKA
jgi:hypothetical protein